MAKHTTTCKKAPTLVMLREICMETAILVNPVLRLKKGTQLLEGILVKSIQLHNSKARLSKTTAR